MISPIDLRLDQCVMTTAMTECVHSPTCAFDRHFNASLETTETLVLFSVR